MQLCSLKNFVCLSLLVLSFLYGETNGANILFFTGITNYSHRMSMWPLVEKLVEKGHRVTFFSANPPGALLNKKVIEFVPKSLNLYNKKLMSDTLIDMRIEDDYMRIWHDLVPFSLDAYAALTEDAEFLEWYKTANYDLVVVDTLYCEFAMGLAHKLKAKFAYFSTTHPYMWQNDALGIPVEASWLPDMEKHFLDGDQMTFWQRVINNFRPLYWELLRSWWYFPATEKLLRENLGITDLPNLRELERNVSLLYTNTHFTEEYARSVPPNVISIGGMHCNLYKDPLPKDLQNFLDSSGPSGFVYVSLGSAAKISTMPSHLREIFFNVMRKANTKFVVKWTGDVPKDMPKNVFPAPWLAQQTVLGHPNIKAFITHGGLLGIQEAICDAVPTIIFPIFGEQDYNANRLQQRNLGIKLEWKGLTEEVLGNALTEILTKPSYKENMKQLSKIFLDRPSKPLDLAVWWTEYILRYDHVQLLNPLGIRQSWYKRRSLDVWFFVFTVISLPLWIFLLCLCRRKSSADKVNSRKSNDSKSSNKKKN